MDGHGEGPNDGWGPFGRPLFNDPAAKALSRVGVVDVGSNSVRLVVFDGAARSPAYFYNEKLMCGLGANLAETGRLNPEGRDRAMKALIRFQRLAETMGITPLTAVATAAVREAEDGPAFRDEVRERTGLELYVIDGQEEARLSAQGVLLGWPDAQGLVSDIGGSSMELAEVADGQVGKTVTSALGPLRLKTLKGGRKSMVRHIRKTVAGLHEQIDATGQRLFLVGGSWRAIARIDMYRRKYPLSVIHEYRMSPSDIEAVVAYISRAKPETLRSKIGLSEARMALVPIAALVLKELVDTFQPSEIALSSYGIREGLLFEQMPQPLRLCDPLIEACRFAEAKDARIPGFGRLLSQFVKPLFPDVSPERRRIIKAACLIHDVSWRAHPDYRHELVFDNATRANLGGLTHSERVYIGVALLHRYKNSRAGSRFEKLFDLIPPEDLQEAEVLGKAMRFGAMLSTDDPEEMARLEWDPKSQALSLRLTPPALDLFGEVVEARFGSLATAIGAKTVVVSNV